MTGRWWQDDDYDDDEKHRVQNNTFGLSYQLAEYRSSRIWFFRYSLDGDQLLQVLLLIKSNYSTIIHMDYRWRV